MVWLGAVGIDRTRTSDIEFQPFEHSWVVTPQERQHLASMKSIAVMPFLGDTVMADWWAAVLRHMTDLRVVKPSGVARQGHPNVNPEFFNGLTDDEQSKLAQRMSAESQVDSVLFGSVAGQEPQNSFAGLKENSQRRLSLHLVSAKGTLMWKTEMPFTMVQGAKDLDEDLATQALLTHVKAHANELGFTGFGATTRQTAPRSSSDTSDNQMACPFPEFEHP